MSLFQVPWANHTVIGLKGRGIQGEVYPEGAVLSVCRCPVRLRLEHQIRIDPAGSFQGNHGCVCLYGVGPL